jgi:two-component system nitrate/nitrite response regulator NarL
MPFRCYGSSPAAPPEQGASAAGGGERLSGPIRVFVVDDHALVREGLLRLLASDSSIEIAGYADSIAGTLAQLPGLPVDILILDYDLGGETALPLVRALKEQGFPGRILIVTAGLPNRDALELIRLGVSGIFHKKNPPEDLHRSIVEVAAGKVLIEQSYFQSLVESAEVVGRPSAQYSDRDQQILRYLLEGCQNKEIATHLRLSESAVKASLQGLFAKTGVRTRSQLVRFALEQMNGSQQ